MQNKKSDCKKIENPSIFHLKETCFLRLNKLKVILKKIKPLQELKITDEDIYYIKKEILELSNLISVKDNEDLAEILPLFYVMFKNLKEVPRNESNNAIRIKRILDDYSGDKRLTLKMIALIYEKEYSKQISLMSVSRILRNNLKIHYRKTVLKNPKLKDDNYIIMTFLFLKYLSNCLKNKLNLIFIDETGFSLDNPNLRMWRKGDEQIYGGPKIYGKERINLILAIDRKEIIYGEYYHNETITTEEFKEFIKELIKRIDKETIKKTVFILDNASYHCTNSIEKFANENKLKFLFTVPYKSEFNPIELCFNLMKNYIYNEEIKNIAILKKRIAELIEDEKVNQNIPKIYQHTLNSYVNFISDNCNKYDIKKLCGNILGRKRKRNK